MRFWRVYDGLIVHGDAFDPDVQAMLPSSVRLSFLDPPYGKTVKEKWDQGSEDAILDVYHRATDLVRSRTVPGGALYCWGAMGEPRYRPFFRFLSGIENRSAWEMAALITWKKKRAYGVQNNYLLTREECAYLVNGDAGKPAVFNVPYLDQLRGYDGYDPEHPALSRFLRRTMVWDDITEILSGKEHPTEKPERLYEVPILVHTEPGDTVLDIMAGSGVAARAARKHGRKFVIVEREESYIPRLLRDLNKPEPVTFGLE